MEYFAKNDDLLFCEDLLCANGSVYLHSEFGKTL